MAQQEIDIRGGVPAPPAVVWRWLSESSTWPQWTPIERCEIERPAGPDGLGEIRVFRTGRYRIREQIVEFVPDKRLSYTLLSGLALNDYRAEIDLAGNREGGTDLRWHTTFTAKLAIFGGVYRAALTKRTQQFVDGLAAQVRSHPVDELG